MKKLLLTTTILATSILVAGCGAKEETIVETTNTDEVVSDVVETEEIIVDEADTEEIETETEEEESADYIREISIDGVKVKMPCAVEEFEALGFTPNPEEVILEQAGRHGYEDFYKTPSGADMGVRKVDGYIYEVFVEDCEVMGFDTNYAKPDKFENFKFQTTYVGAEAGDDYDYDYWSRQGEHVTVYYRDDKLLAVSYIISH